MKRAIRCPRTVSIPPASKHHQRLLPARSFASTGQRHKAFKLSDIGEGINEVSIIQWYKKTGEEIEEFDQLVEVASDKATVDITAPWSGKLVKRFGEEGDNKVIRTGESLCDIVGEEEEPAPKAETPKVQETTGKSEKIQSTSTPVSSQDHSKAEPSLNSTNFASPPITQHSNTKTDHGEASPATRFLAKKHDIDLKQVKGSGKNGRITKSDILHLASSHYHDDRPGVVPTDSIPVVSTSPSPLSTPGRQAGQTMPLEPFRQAMFRAMTASLKMPHFAYSDEIDVTEAEKFRIRLNRNIPSKYRDSFERITLLPILVKALSQAMFEHPIFTATANTSDSTPSLQFRPNHDISIALSASNGALFTPIIPAVDQMSILEIAAHISLLQRTSPRFTPDMLKPATITLSNIGVVGGTYTHPVIPPTGQLAIGAFGKVKPVLTYTQDQLAAAKAAALGTIGAAEFPIPSPRLIMSASFTADHRFVAGVELAQLVATWKRYLESPDTMLGAMR